MDVCASVGASTEELGENAKGRRSVCINFCTKVLMYLMNFIVWTAIIISNYGTQQLFIVLYCIIVCMDSWFNFHLLITHGNCNELCNLCKNGMNQAIQLHNI
jgi:hypothetical protein